MPTPRKYTHCVECGTAKSEQRRLHKFCSAVCQKKNRQRYFREYYRRLMTHASGHKRERSLLR